MKHTDIAPNESQLTLVTIASEPGHEDVEEPPLTKQESGLEAPVTSKSNPTRTTASKEKVLRCSHVQVICIMLTVATLVIVVGVTVPVLFYYLLVGEVGNRNHDQYLSCNYDSTKQLHFM